MQNISEYSQYQSLGLMAYRFENMYISMDNRQHSQQAEMEKQGLIVS